MRQPNYFFNGHPVKLNAQAYKRHLQKELLPAVQRFYIHKNWIFIMYHQCKAMYHHTVLTSYKIFYKKYSIYVLSKHMNAPTPLHVIVIPSIIIFGIKWKKKYMTIDLTSSWKTRDNWRLKVYGKILPSIYQGFKGQANSLLED